MLIIINNSILILFHNIHQAPSNAIGHFLIISSHLIICRFIREGRRHFLIISDNNNN